MPEECVCYTFKEGDYHCTLMKKDVDRDWVHKYCWNYGYSDCPFYKEKMS